MNDYRSYFDRIKVSNTLHQRLLSGERAEKQRAPVLVRYGSMVACLALICLAGFGVWRWSTPHVGGDISVGDSLIPGEKDTYGPGETPPALAIPTPVPGKDLILDFDSAQLKDSILTSKDPVGGPPHSMFNITSINYGDGVGYAVPPERVNARHDFLTREQMIDILGGSEELGAPWTYGWQGHEVMGTVYYDDLGAVTMVMFRGRDQKDNSNMFTLVLEPGVDSAAMLKGEYKMTEIRDRKIRGDHYQSEEGSYGYHIAFNVGDVGVYFGAAGHDEKHVENLATLFANFAEEFYLEQLVSEKEICGYPQASQENE